MAHIDPEQSVAQVVLEHPAAAAVFERHGIDYCCGGATRLAEASFLRGVELDDLLLELEAASEAQPADPLLEIRGLDTAELVQHILRTGDGTLGERARELAQLAQTVAELHGGENPLLIGLSGAVGELADALEAHLREEREELLVPAREGCVGGKLAPLLRELLDDHRLFGQLLAEIRSFAEDFHVPPWGCASYRRLFAELEAFEAALRHRVHLVNNALAARLDG